MRLGNAKTSEIQKTRFCTKSESNRFSDFHLTELNWSLKQFMNIFYAWSRRMNLAVFLQII